MNNSEEKETLMQDTKFRWTRYQTLDQGESQRLKAEFRSKEWPLVIEF